jgi:hypothetical protein
VNPVITQDDIDYVTRTVALNPMTEPERIIASRARRIDPKKSSCPPKYGTTTVAERRLDCLREIQEIREQFWALDQEALLSKLDQPDFSEFADLNVACRALKSTAMRRVAFQRLQEHPHAFAAFMDTLKNIAIAPPGKVTELRNRLRNSALKGTAYPDRHSRREFRRLAETIENEFPEIASVYGTLLQEITTATSHSSRVGKLLVAVGRILTSKTTLIVLSVIFVIVIRFLLKVLK